MSVLGNSEDIKASFIEECAHQLSTALDELIERGKTEPGSIIVIGCSTSEIAGSNIGSRAYPNLGQALASAALEACASHGIYLAAQCCEHLNRALVIEREAVKLFGLERVTAIPTPEAGGSFATAVYHSMRDAVLVESIKADAGIDIGDTLIGMHLRRVAVPVRLSVNTIGHARVVAAITRPAYTGGPRAQYS